MNKLFTLKKNLSCSFLIFCEVVHSEGVSKAIYGSNLKGFPCFYGLTNPINVALIHPSNK